MILTDAEADGETADAAEAEVRKTCDNHHDIASDLGPGDRLSACSTACSTGWARHRLPGGGDPAYLIDSPGRAPWANGKRQTRAERGFFFDFRQEHDASAFGM
jgi:hypothetical protein